MGAAESIKSQSDAQAKFIHAFVTSAIHTFQVQCRYEVVAQKPRLLTPNENLDVTICSVIGLVSSVFRGSVILCLNDRIFLGLMSGMFGEKMEVLTNELSDGIGELLNIVFGTAKTKLTNDGISVDKALPTVIRGAEIKINSVTSDKPTIVVPLSGPDGVFNLLITLDQQTKP